MAPSGFVGKEKKTKINNIKGWYNYVEKFKVNVQKKSKLNNYSY